MLESYAVPATVKSTYIQLTIEHSLEKEYIGLDDEARRLAFYEIDRKNGGRKMKKIITCVLAFFGLFAVAGCSTDEKIKELEDKNKELSEKVESLTKEKEDLIKEKDTLTEENTTLKDQNTTLEGEKDELEAEVIRLSESFQINVYDIDDELLGTQTLKCADYDTLWEGLTTYFDVSYTESEYGPYISSINGSIVDSNYFVSIYENGAQTTTGVEGVSVDSGDVFDFKVECWNTIESGYGTMDSYDVLVDKAIYGYIKNYLNQSLAKATTYTGTSYWEFMSLIMLKRNGYLPNDYEISLSDEFIASLKTVDLSKLSGNLFKYYYAQKALGNDLDEFKDAYESLVTENHTYSEYATPFYLGVAIDLGLTENNIVDAAKNAATASTDWGYDAYCWQLASNALVKDVENSLVEAIPTSFSNGTSASIPLMVYSALGLNPRTGNDRIKALFDTYYDAELNIVKYNTSDTGVQMSTNQIYTSLISYKISRDLGKSINVFA